MSRVGKVVGSTVGSKILVGITGLGLVGFLVAHLAGNLLIYAEPGADGVHPFNAYDKMLTSNPALPVLEAGLLLFFLVHIGLTIRLTLQNRAARGDQGYAQVATRRSGIVSVLASRSMAVSGAVVLLFLCVHLWDFRGQRGEHADLVAYAHEALSQPLRAVLYTVGSLLVAWHVSHGFHSAFRSLGFHHPKYTPLLEKAAAALAILLGLGFASIPAWIYLGAGS